MLKWARIFHGMFYSVLKGMEILIFTTPPTESSLMVEFFSINLQKPRYYVKTSNIHNATETHRDQIRLLSSSSDTEAIKSRTGNIGIGCVQFDGL